MKSVAVLAAAAAGASAMSLDADVALFQEWKSKHAKVYMNDDHELEKFQTFKANAAYINSHNMNNNQFTLALNEFADLTHEEYKDMLLGSGRAPERTGSAYLPTDLEIPSKVDWRTKGYVTPVKNQGQCGSCWAFSTVASLEGQYYRKNHKLVSFSEQQLVDCAGSFGNNGCNGGLMDNAFQYIKTLKNGLDTEASYPYTARDGRCKASQGKGANPAARVTGFTDIQQGNENDLANALASVGPVSIAIDAAHQSFQFYNAGVYVEPACSSNQLDHGVTAVGYGTENGQDFFLVKNSWGTGWGDAGYIKMARNKDNQCGVATSASYPLL